MLLALYAVGARESEDSLSGVVFANGDEEHFSGSHGSEVKLPVMASCQCATTSWE